MRKISLGIYGISVELSSSSDFAFENLRKDFALYINGQSRHSDRRIRMQILKEQVPFWKVPPLEASLYSRGSVCYRNDGVHYVDYEGKGLMIYDFAKEKADIYSLDENLLYEKARLALLSRIGESLDRRHLHRVHAATFSKNKKAVMLLLPTQGGKTTLVLRALKKDSNLQLISEDVCFVDSKAYVYPFMLRIGAKDEYLVKDIPQHYITKINRDFYGEKHLIDLEYIKGRIAGKSKVQSILIGKHVFQDNTEIRKLSKIRSYFPFIQSGVFELGLPQIVELFLRHGLRDVFRKAGIVFSRTLLFLKLVSCADTYQIRMGRDIDKCVEKLINFINKD